MTRNDAIRFAMGLRTTFKCDSNDMVDFCNTAIEALKQAPLKTGHWIYNKYNTHEYKCSECGRDIETYSFEDPYIRYPYCHCGAKMESEKQK